MISMPQRKIHTRTRVYLGYDKKSHALRQHSAAFNKEIVGCFRLTGSIRFSICFLRVWLQLFKNTAVVTIINPSKDGFFACPYTEGWTL